MATRLGLDYAFSKPTAAAIRAAGYTFACRYLGGSADKDLTSAERDALRAAGIDIVANWEGAAGAARAGRPQGVKDAQAALGQATALGLPMDRPIYFSYDFGGPYSWPAIEGYAAGVVSVLGITRAGAYGGHDLIEHLHSKGLAAWFWQTYAWSGGKWSSAAHLRQVQNGITVGGADCDKDQAMAADFGQWGADVNLTDSVAGTSTPDHKADRNVGEILHDAAQLRGILIGQVPVSTYPAGSPLAKLLAGAGAGAVDLDALAAKVAALLPAPPSAADIAAALVAQLSGKGGQGA